MMKSNKLKLLTSPAQLLRMLAAIVLSLMACLHASAEESMSGPALRVHLQSGEKQMFLLASEPVITFAKEKCHIASADFSADYDMAEIQHADFVADASAGIAEKEFSLVVDLSNPEFVTIHGLEADTQVSLYSIAGVAQRVAKADNSGTAVITLAGLQSGVYIVTTNQTTFKIYRK